MVNTSVRNCHCHDLWAKCWEFRKTDCLELNLFAAQETLSQITQSEAKAEPGKRPARFNFNPFGYVLMILADVCAADSSQKIHSELSLRLSVFRFFPGPFFLNQLSLLSELRMFLVDLAGGKFVSDHSV